MGKGDTWFRIDHFKMSIFNRKTFSFITETEDEIKQIDMTEERLKKTNSLFR